MSLLGYYVHHHGSGHLARAGIVARACGVPVVGLSSLPEPPRPHPFAGWVQLAADPALPEPVDPTAGGTLHWAPLNSAGYTERMHQLVQWCAVARPGAVLVDLSVEVSALLRLCGVPVVVMTLPGHRDDAAHRLAFGLAARIVAPWPRAVYDPPHLHGFADKVRYTGALSRFDDAAVPAAVPAAAAAGGTASRLVALSGSGGGAAADVVLRELVARRGWTYRELGAGSWSDDVAAELSAATVVVTHAGTNALAEVAALRRPAVVVAQERPFGEQAATATALDAAGIAVAAAPGTDLPAAVRRALALGGDGWSRWNDGRGAARVAGAVTEVLAGVAA